VLTKGEEKAVEVALERAPEGASTNEVLLGGRSPFAGAKVAVLSPRLAQRLRVATDTKGVVIVGVDGGSAAAGFGFQAGDIVRELNGETIDTAEKLKQLAEEDTRWWRFTVERDGRIMRQMLRY
jgi:S1-C subfamily serine protease